MNKYEAILVSGFARSGKDTFYNLLYQIDNQFINYSFAAQLKHDLKDLLGKKMGIDVFNPTEEQKKIIRPILIAYGCAWREIDINHWVKMVNENIEHNKRLFHHVPVITDTRFLSEAEFFIDKYGRDKVLIVEIVRPDGPTPPKEELENQPKITAIADCRIVWDTDPTFETLREYVGDFYRKYFQS